MNRRYRIAFTVALSAALSLAAGCTTVPTDAGMTAKGLKTRLAPAEEARFLHDYARLLIRHERYDRAEMLLDDLRARHPDSMATLDLLATLYEQQGRPGLALVARREIHHRRPDDAAAGARYARAALLNERYAEAEAVFRKWLEEMPAGSRRAIMALNNLAYSALLQGHHRRAVTLLERALAADPLNRRARANLALTYQLEGRTRSAEEVLDAAPAGAPKPYAGGDHGRD